MADSEKSSSESDKELNPAGTEATGEALVEEGGGETVEEGGEAGADAAEPQNRRARRTAASQARKQRLREREEAQAVGLDAQEILDDALVRSTDSAGKWFRNNSTWLQAVAVAVVAVWAGWGIYSWQMDSAQASASSKVAEAIAAERGRVGDPPVEANTDFPDPTPQFKDDPERVGAAKEAFKAAAEKRTGSGTAVYSELALGALALDEKKYDEALELFAAVKDNSLSASDPELRGRSLEGIALATAGKGDAAATMKAYEALQKAEISGFSELALYHQARLQHELGDSDAAKLLAEKLNQQLSKSAPGKPQESYLGQLAKNLSEELGIAVPEVESQAPSQITPEQLKALQEQMQRAIQDKVPAKAAVTDPAPSAAVTDPAPSAAVTGPAPTAPAPAAAGTAKQ